MQTQIKHLLGGAVLLALLLSLLRPLQAEATPLPAAALPGGAEADGGPGSADAAQMQAEMHRYFDGERRGGIWLMGVGAPMMALGTGLAFHPHGFAQGLGYSVLAVGVIELAAGAMFYRNSNTRVPRFDALLRRNAAAFREEELTRIRRVNREMRLLEAVEISLILAGGVLTCAGALQGQDVLTGVGTGVMLQSGVLLVYDQLAARRALRYFGALTRFSVALAPGAGTTPGGALLLGQGRF
jgi:hypothetical protein